MHLEKPTPSCSIAFLSILGPHHLRSIFSTWYQEPGALGFWASGGLQQRLLLVRGYSVPTLLKRPQLTCTRLTISNLQNDVHHPRKATPIDLTHQTYAHLLYFPTPSRWTSSTFVVSRTSSIDREDPLYWAHPVSGISEVVRTSQFVSPWYYHFIID